MSIDIKQLTINSSIKPDEADEESSVVEGKSSSKESSACFDIDVVRAEILAECKRMIRRAAEEQRSR